MKSVTLETQDGDMTITRDHNAYDEDSITIDGPFSVLRISESDAEALIVALSIILGKGKS